MAEAIDRFGPDAFRYFLLREVPFDADGSYSWERFEERYNADLANAWGNLASRVVAMVEKYFAGTVPRSPRTPLDDADARDLAEYHAAMDGTSGFLLHQGLAAVWRTVARANEFVQSSAPWTLAKDPARRPELEAVLGALVRSLARQAVCIAPFMPNKAQELWAQLGAPGTVNAQRYDGLATLEASGWSVRKGAPLFPKEEKAG